MGLLPAKYSVQKLWPQISNVFYHCFKSMGIVHVLSVGCVCEHSADQGLFWQKPWSLHTSKSEAVHLGKRSGSICNGEACAKCAFLRIWGENEPIPSLKMCITGWFWLCVKGGRRYRQGWTLSRFCSAVLVTCSPQLWALSVQCSFPRVTRVVFVFKRWQEALKWFFLCWAGFILWVHTLQLWAACVGDVLTLDLCTRSAQTEIGSVFQSSSWALVCSPLWWFSNPRS